MKLKRQRQWMDAIRNITEEELEEQYEFRQKLYRKYREDVETQ